MDNKKKCIVTIKEIDAILSNFKNIAAIDLSPDPNEDSHKISAYMQSQGYHVYPVNSEEEIILGEPVHRNLDDIREPIDLVIVFGTGPCAIELLEQMRNHPDIRGFWVQCSSFNENTIKEAEKMGLKVVQDKCIMIEHRRYIGDYK